MTFSNGIADEHRTRFSQFTHLVTVIRRHETGHLESQPRQRKELEVGTPLRIHEPLLGGTAVDVAQEAVVIESRLAHIQLRPLAEVEVGARVGLRSKTPRVA